tara:strand:- start:46422 stop:47369 length:948 start_codon:yes stop_codon:yes gene_type:complete
MPNENQLRYNTARVQPEGTVGDTGDDTNVLQMRLSNAGISRDIAGSQERSDPWRTREFNDVVHQGWNVELFGELRTGGFLPWLLSMIAEAGTAERGLDVWELNPAATDPSSYAVQFEGIDGTSTFTGCKVKRINLQLTGRKAITYAIELVALTRSTTEGTWTTTGTEAGDILTTSTAQLALAGDLAADPDSNTETGYEASIELYRGELDSADFSADGIPQGHTAAGAWDVTGKVLMPETTGITDEAIGSTFNGEINLRCGSEAGETLEIEAGIIGVVTKRRTISDDFKQATIDFVSRRGSNQAIARFLTDQPSLT